MKPTPDAMTIADALAPSAVEATAEVHAWQAEKIKAGLRDADAGRFVTPEQVRAMVQKFIPNG